MWRPVAVWASVTVGGAGAGLAVPGTWRAAGASAGPGAVADVLVATCATVLALALGWLWTITSVTVAGVLTGRVGTRGGATRRLVLVACGAAVLAGAG
ncbi:hypothetical protein, partial [Nocardioides sp.]|uniref:hypothetical protein n=1 Tax=Nocardioides sp. TaxID=35761 RepID=UPI00260C2C25